MKAFIKTLTMATALAFASTASAAIVYNVNQTVQAGGVVGTITTDGTLGSIGSGNITAWNLNLSGGAATFNLNNGNSGVFLTVPSHVTATAQNLFFDYGTPDNGYLLFQVSFGSGAQYWCNAAGIGTSTCFQGATVTPQSIFDPSVQVEARTGVQIIATAGAVPEPAAWGLMLAGFGLTGAAMRRRAKVRITYA